MLHRQRKTYTHKGKSLTAAQWAARLGISTGSFYERLRKYKTSDAYRIFEKPRIGLHTYGGFTGTLDQWEIKTGIPKKTLQSRLYEGWSYERAFTTPYQQRNDVKKPLTKLERIARKLPTDILKAELSRREK